MEAELVMKKEELHGKYKSEYQKRIIERFADTIPEYIYPPNDDASRKNYDIYMSFICLLEAPEQYQTADKVIDYLEKNPPVNEDMLRSMMMSMGQKPSEKKIRQMMQQMKNQGKK